MTNDELKTLYEKRPKLLHEVLRYDPETGRLFWRARPPGYFSKSHVCRWWNARYAGKEAFTAKDRKGYKVGNFCGGRRFAHRLIWAMSTGSWPENEIDHINGDVADNRMSNLRDATKAENMHNMRTSVRNTSGVKGVTWHAARGKWMAQIMANGKRTCVGYFSRLESAKIAIRKKRAELHGGHANHG